jgi:hypothetical protein
MLKCVYAVFSVAALCVSVHASAAAQTSDLTVKLYGDGAKAEKAAEKGSEKKPADTAPKQEADAGTSTIIRCVDKGRVTFTNGKCESGTAQATAVRRAEPATNQVTRSSTSGAPPKPLAALPPLYETVQATSDTAGYELREQCAKIDSQLGRLDAQAQLALPKAEPEANRKKREELQRKRHSLRCG